MLKTLFRKKTVHQIVADTENPDLHTETTLHRNLGVRDLTALGIAAIVGAGIFSTIGTASANGGPGVVFLFLFTALACSFAAFAYAEFASLVPVSGSAYTYSYVAFGELAAWIIGWALIMEYAIGNITVAISWSEYFCRLLEGTPWQLPYWLRMDVVTAYNGFNDGMALMKAGKPLISLDPSLQNCIAAFNQAPDVFGIKLIFNLPAIGILIFMTYIVYRGIKESKNAGNAMVIIKLAVIVLVIIIGAAYVNTDNWSPFAPEGMTGILKGVSSVFFAYIGFDAISTTAEECKNPQRDLPRGMMWSIIICTIIYVLVALVLTGMVPYKQLAVGDPLAFVFDVIQMPWMAKVVAVSAVIATASVILVFQLGQPRIWMAMSRDGLLPKKFSKVHPKFKTPSFATIVTGVVVVTPTLFMNLEFVTDLCSIGTLFAFVLVCGGVLKLNATPHSPKGKFKTPYINAKWIVPLLLLTAAVYGVIYKEAVIKDFVFNTPKPKETHAFITERSESEIIVLKQQAKSADSLGFSNASEDLEIYLSSLEESNRLALIHASGFDTKVTHESGWELFRHKIPMYIFMIVLLLFCVMGFRYNFSLIPLLGLLCCLYMMAELGLKNWIGFGLWLLLGLVIYFAYGFRKSKLAIKK